MKVAAIHNLQPGGAHRRLTQQLAYLDADVTEVCLSTAQPATATAEVVPYRPAAPRAPRIARPPLRYRDLDRLQRAWDAVADRLQRRRPDVVFANPCRFLQAPAALPAISAPSLYFCDEPREWAEERAATQNPLTRGVYRRLHATELRLDRDAVAAATRLATNSQHTAAAIERCYGRRAAVLPMGIPAGFTPTWEPAYHLLSVGALIPDKGHDLVVRAAALARTPRPLLIVAPRQNRPEQERLAAIAGALGVDLTVRVAVPDADLVAAYRRAHATLYLAREEPFGLASLEAQACGSPVIASDTGGLPETLRPGETGWTVARRPEAVAQTLDRLDDSELRSQLAHAAAAHAADASWQRAAGALQDMLTELCARQPGASG